MVTGKKDDLAGVTTESTAVEVSGDKGEGQTTTPTEGDTLRQQIAEANARLTEAIEAKKVVERALTRKGQEAEQLSRKVQEAERLEREKAELELELAILKDRMTEAQEEGIEKPQIGANVQAILAKRQSRPEQTPQQQENAREIGKIWALIEEAGFDPMSPDFKIVKEYAVNMSAFGLAEREAKQVILELKKAKEPVPPKETEEVMRERIRQEVLRESPGFKTETGKPAGGGMVFTKAGIAAMPIKDFEANQAEINKARREGRIKD